MSEQAKSAVARRRPLFSQLDPWRRMDPLRGMLDEIFADLPQDAGNVGLVVPKVDVTETDDAYRVRAEIPGVSKEDVTVQVEEGSLSIRGEKRSERDEKTEKGRRLECSYGAFERSFLLPQDADTEKISAAFKDGVLEIEVAKSPESKPKQIAVKG